jgi:hypothetical protein
VTSGEANDVIELGLRLERHGAHLQGALLVDRREFRRFDGWLQLMAAVEDAKSHAEASSGEEEK